MTLQTNKEKKSVMQATTWNNIKPPDGYVEGKCFGKRMWYKKHNKGKYVKDMIYIDPYEFDRMAEEEEEIDINKI